MTVAVSRRPTFPLGPALLLAMTAVYAVLGAALLRGYEATRPAP